MKTFTITDIRSWKPCYDPSKHLPEDWEGTVLDILRNEAIPAEDRFWVVLREDLIDAKTLRLFAVWCARQVEHLMTDPRSIAALDVAERYARGEATQEDLAAASAAAGDAARAAAAAARAAAWDAAPAARDAAWDAALDAAWAALDAARDAAWAAAPAALDAAGAAARDAAWDAARDAASAAALDAARAAARDAAWAAARDAARAAALDAQIKQMMVMLNR